MLPMCQPHEGYVEARWKIASQIVKPIEGAAMKRASLNNEYEMPRSKMACRSDSTG